MVDATVHITRAPNTTMVRLRVPPAVTGDAAAALGLPIEALTWVAGDPAILWLAPDQWLLTSSTVDADVLLRRCEERLEGILHHAVDVSDALDRVSVDGPSSRHLLAMLTGIDLTDEVFPVARCARTRLAKLAVVVQAVDRERIDLLVDRSLSKDLLNQLSRAAAGVRSRSRGTPA
jgi:sarcosine oxidase, subunit gamma